MGKVYLWNTKKPHRPTIIKPVITKQPRINVVIGLTAWLNYDKDNDSYSKNKYFGKPINEIVREKLFSYPIRNPNKNSLNRKPPDGNLL